MPIHQTFFQFPIVHLPFQVAILDEKILGIEREISRLKEQRDERVGSTQGAIKLVIVADEEITINLKLTYSKALVPNH